MKKAKLRELLEERNKKPIKKEKKEVKEDENVDRDSK